MSLVNASDSEFHPSSSSGSDPDTAAEVEVRHAAWDDPGDQALLMEVRALVFVMEQKVPAEIEIDDLDPVCLHVLAFARNGESIVPVGTARLDEAGHVGRVAVKKHWRRHGVGSRLMHCLIAEARSRGQNHLELNSQVSAIPFYESLGFAVDLQVAEFEEAGITHRRMIMNG